MTGREEKETDVQPDPLKAHGLVMRPCPHLAWTDDAGPHEHALFTQRADVGSRDTVDICLVDASVSRLHAEFRLLNDSLWIFDSGSKNGTYVDGVRVSGAQTHDGAIVRMGGVELAVSLSAPPVAVEIWPFHSYDQMVGNSVVMRELYATLDRVAKTPLSVLIEGETGTGKELAARAIHAASDRADGPFVVVDCGALVESVLESELFGHVRGAFTGAIADRVGCIESAHRGTVFLDEIGELPLDLQTKLLRVIEEQSIRRLGETNFRKVDVRFVSATHRNLREMVNTGLFREDLYFRVAVFVARMPALRERLEDIPLLLKALCPDGERAHLTPAFLEGLATRSWLGNVRELRSYLARARAFGPDLAQSGFGAPASNEDEAARFENLDFSTAREQVINEFERDFLRQALEQADGNVRSAAESKGVSYGYFYRLMRKHNL